MDFSFNMKNQRREKKKSGRNSQGDNDGVWGAGDASPSGGHDHFDGDNRPMKAAVKVLSTGSGGVGIANGGGIANRISSNGGKNRLQLAVGQKLLQPGGLGAKPGGFAAGQGGGGQAGYLAFLQT